MDWSSSLGSKGVPVDIIRSLNSVFGLGTDFSGSAISGGAAAGATEDAPIDTSNIILTPFQLSGVMRALKEGNLVTQKSNPVVITEDNEKAVIALIDRVPIITSTVNNTGNGASTTTDEVRYKIDESDSTEPDKTREIGVTIAMTPSLLPDGTIRMNMRPRNAQIVENITGPSGNVYPRVSEATVESIARIPDGNSLIVGGFYGEIDSNAKNKVPLLGNIPILKFFFKSKETRKERSSLVFVVTPTSYNPACVKSNRSTNTRVRHQMAAAEENLQYEEGRASRLSRAIRGSQTTKAPSYPQR
jgi:type II secretory pathway component GspD/PulD (secretin)